MVPEPDQVSKAHLATEDLVVAEKIVRLVLT